MSECVRQCPPRQVSAESILWQHGWSELIVCGGQTPTRTNTRTVRPLGRTQQLPRLAGCIARVGCSHRPLYFSFAKRYAARNALSECTWFCFITNLSLTSTRLCSPSPIGSMVRPLVTSSTAFSPSSGSKRRRSESAAQISVFSKLPFRSPENF